MEDKQIVELYWQRQEAAIRETEQKYGHYLTQIAYHILSDWEDSQESVNDTYFKAWNSIPPNRPEPLAPYLRKILREAAIDCYRRKRRKKRGQSEYSLSLSELGECVSGGDTTGQEIDRRLLAEAVAVYLKTLSPEARGLFIGRYYFMDSMREVAAYHGMSEPKAKSMLHRTRKGLKAYLEKEGFFV